MSMTTAITKYLDIISSFLSICCVSFKSCVRMKQQPPPSQTQQPQTLNCPRCNSANTKFCYYNNYSLSQPRHFCKACKRYWTRGGTLRSVPVGGGCRKKNKKTTNKMVNSDFLAIESRPTTTAGNINQIFNTAYDNNQSQFNAFKPAFPSLGTISFQADITSFPRFGASPSSNMGGPKETKDDSQYRTLFPIQDILMTGYGSNKQAIMNMGAHGIEQHNNAPFDSSIYWNSIGAWPDLINHESSETSLI